LKPVMLKALGVEGPSLKTTAALKKKRGSASERRPFLADLIGKGKYTRKEILEKAAEKFPEASASALLTLVTDGKNPKYNKFDHLIVESAEKILSFQK